MNAGSRMLVLLASLLAGLSVAAGAFGAHALKTRIEPRMLEVWETAARYQMYHALALLALAWLAERRPSRIATFAAMAFLAGILLFSGSLYAMALTGSTGLGAVTPFGGVAFLAGWLLLALTARG
jgi:uncharacterized membrane protein YgdD (TMEM256/DUF423 family)